MLCAWRGRGLCTGRGRGEGTNSRDPPDLCISTSPAGCAAIKAASGRAGWRSVGPAGGNIGSAPINSPSVNSFLKLTATRTTITATEMIATDISVRLPIDVLSIWRKVRSTTRIALLNKFVKPCSPGFCHNPSPVASCWPRRAVKRRLLAMSLTKDAHSKIVPVNSSMSINDCRCFDDYSNGFCRIDADVQKIWHNKQGKWLTQKSARRRV